MKTTLQYTNEEKTEFFVEGDNIICCLESGKRYIGRIGRIGTYQKDEKSEPETAIYIETSKDKTGSSGELVMAGDITYICKVPLNVIDYPKINEEKDRNQFISMLIGLGIHKERAEAVHKSIKDIVYLYNVPLSAALAGAIQEVANPNTDKRCQEELDAIGDRFISAIVKVFQSITDSIKTRQKENSDLQDRDFEGFAGK